MMASLLAFVCAAVLIAGWWYLRNTLAYGDPMLIDHHLEIVSRRDPMSLAQVLHEIPSMFYSYWGRFTCRISPGSWYNWHWGIVIIAGGSGVIARWRKLTETERAACALLLVWLALVFAGWLRWNLAASGVQGRLLFPAAASVGIVTGVGLAFWTRRLPSLRGGILLAWAGLALGVLLGFIRPTFAPPPRFARADAPAVPNMGDRAFGDTDARIELLGYDVNPRSLEPGDELEVTLYLSTPAQITDTYSMGLWLVAAAPGDTSRLSGLDTWPGSGNYPTTAWIPGEVIVDTYQVSLPREVERAQAWDVQLNVFRMGGDSWLPCTVDGRASGDRLVLGQVRVGGSAQIEVPTGAGLERPAIFGSAIALNGLHITSRDAASGIELTLWWEALARPGADYTVFVHLLDGQGHLVGTGDGPPLNGGFPTSLWQPGDIVIDGHVIDLPADLPAGGYRAAVGWYDPVSGARLPTEDGDRYVHSAAIRVPAR
jgi:hypothetical protein